MSLPRYPNYKDSGAEWLGEVPEHWEVKRVRFVAQLNPSKSELSALARDTAVSFVPMDAIGEDGSLSLDKEKPISEVETGYTYFRNGDVTVAKITPCYENGKGALMQGLLNGIGFGTTELIVVRPNSGQVTGTYLHYLFISPDFRGLGESHMYGAGGQKRIPDDFVRNFATAFPPVREQTQIAAFLDRETAKIDELVAEQRRLVELLKEKRQAVISHAVTRGLNPDAPLKPSGIEWLGDVPAHWVVVPLRWAAKCCSGDGLSSLEVESVDDEEHQVRVIGGNGVMGYTDQKNVEHSVLAVGRVGALCGNVHIVNPPAWITDNALVLDPDHAVFDLQFLSLVLRSRNLNDIASKTAQPLITGTQVSDQRIPAPPLKEQQDIAAFLTLETSRFDTLTTEAQRAIDLLQERRTALISAAVTGQIDVRGAVAA